MKAELRLYTHHDVYLQTTTCDSWCSFLTCCWAGCWSIWCLCEGSCSYGSSPDPPWAGAWSCGCARGRTGPGPTPANPSGHGPCTQTPGKRHLKQEELRQWRNMFYFPHFAQSWQIISNSSTFVLFKVQRILFIRDNLFHVDDAAVLELSQDLDLSNGCDGETFLFIVQTHFLQSHQLSWWVEMNSQHDKLFSFHIKQVSATVAEFQETVHHLCLCPWPCTPGRRCLPLWCQLYQICRHSVCPSRSGCVCAHRIAGSKSWNPPRNKRNKQMEVNAGSRKGKPRVTEDEQKLTLVFS